MANNENAEFARNILDQIEVFLNESRADILAFDAILKSVILRMLPPNATEFFDAQEQQVLASFSLYEPRQRAQIEPRVVSFFAALRKMHQSDKAILPTGGVH